MKNQYTWETNPTLETWRNSTFDTIKECLAEAKREHGANDDNTVYVGECVPFKIEVSVESMLEQLQDDAFEFAGEAAEDWETYDCGKQSELDELSEQISNVVSDWLKKYNREPHFYQIENVKEYRIGDDIL